MYKIGDKVIYYGADKNAYRKRGVVSAIEEKNGKPQLTVKFDDGETFTAPIDDWARNFRNAKACNAGKAMVSRIGNGWYYEWADGSKDGKEGPFKTEEEARVAAKQDGLMVVNSSVRSTNAVVANALAARGHVARNGFNYKDLKDRERPWRAFRDADAMLAAAQREISLYHGKVMGDKEEMEWASKCMVRISKARAALNK